MGIMILPLVSSIALSLLVLLQKVLHDVADFEDRRMFLENLKDRLEALIAPKLIAAFNSHSSGVWCVRACVCVCVRARACMCVCTRMRVCSMLHGKNHMI